MAMGLSLSPSSVMDPAGPDSVMLANVPDHSGGAGRVKAKSAELPWLSANTAMSKLIDVESK